MNTILRPTGLTLLLLFLLCTCGPARVNAQDFAQPVNDIVTDREAVQAPPLEPRPPRAADIMWEKRVWRVIDVREKINHTFSYPQRPLVSILLDAAAGQGMPLYSPVDDQFTTPLTEADRLSIVGVPDTVAVYDDNGDVTYAVAPREFDPSAVTRYRLQEVWFFNRKTSTREVRILGIAPIVEEKDENGDVFLERPLFWVYFPHARRVLGNEQAFVVGNDAANRSWADVFDSRFFHSSITRESNLYDRRIEDYLPGGRERLIDARRIEAELLGREQDVWSY